MRCDLDFDFFFDAKGSSTPSSRNNACRPRTRAGLDEGQGTGRMSSVERQCLTLKCGLIGFTDPSLISCQRFYPTSCRNGKDRLKHYASKFPVCEVDTSHYAIPTMRVVQDWIAATKQFTGFQFHIKAFGMFTLKQMNFGNLPFVVKNALQESRGASLNFSRTSTVTWDMLGSASQNMLWREFNEKVVALQSAKLLGVVLFQFQLDFTPTPQNKSWVEFCRSNIPSGVKMVVDFRSRLWYSSGHLDTTLKWLEAIDCVNVISDELLHELHRNKLQKQMHVAPPEKSTELASMNLKVTNNGRFVYVRVHRREGKKRLLGDDWMQTWKRRIEDCFLADGKPGKEVHFVMGTSWEDQAVKNCQTLYKVMGISLDRVWRSLHRQSSTLGMLFKKQQDRNNSRVEGDEPKQGGRATASAKRSLPPSARMPRTNVAGATDRRATKKPRVKATPAKDAKQRLLSAFFKKH